MSRPEKNLFFFSLLTAVATLFLISVGGVVTSKEAGMSVPDWPNSYGYNMFLFPASKWIGGILWEHSHRLAASTVGMLVVILTRWLGGSASRLPLAIIGFTETVLGIALIVLAPHWKGAGYFLSGIGSVVFLAALLWVRNQPAPRPLPMLGWIAFVAVQVQGLLGGLRVVLLNNDLGIFHAMLAQLFFVVVCLIALMTSQFWKNLAPSNSASLQISRAAPVLCGLILCQLALGATMRHQHAGLAIPDFPLAYGKLWPATDPASVELYNQKRLETTNINSITAFQIKLQMVHRIVAVMILGAIVAFALRVWRKFGPFSPLGKFASLWLGLVILQATLGAATIWSDKAADIATAHVIVGALLLANGALVCIISSRSRVDAPELNKTYAARYELPEAPITRPSAATK